MKSIKSLAATVDRKLFVGQISKVYSDLIDESRLHNHRAESYGFGFDVEYGKHASILNALCDRYGSDKGELTSEGNPYPWQSHTYADVYELLFQLRRNDVRLVVERSEEHTSELQSLMRISYAVFCLKQKKQRIRRARTQTEVKHHEQKRIIKDIKRIHYKQA